MDGVSKCWRGNRAARCHHIAHRLVGRDPPANGNGLVAETSRIFRIRREAGPEHDAAGGRVTGRDTEGEWVVAKPLSGEQAVARQEREREAGAHAMPGLLEKPASIDC